MMVPSTFDSQYKDVLCSLEQHRLLDALRGMAAMADGKTAGSFAVQLERLQEDYSMMLSCMGQGMVDPERERIYGQFLRRAAELVEELKHAQMVAKESSYLGVVYRRSVAFSNGSSGEAEFDKVYASAPLSKEDYERYSFLLGDADTPASLKWALSAAMLLSLMHVFDAYKLRLLADCSYSKDVELRARCLVGLALAVRVYDKRVRNIPELFARLSLLGDDPVFATSLRIVQLQLLLSRRTRQDSRKVNEDIIPEMLKVATKMHLKEGMDFLKLNEIELNPEWEENGRKSHFHEAMQRVIGMQEKGVDMFFKTFAQTMRYQPFFSEASHWFVPFSFENEVFGDKRKVLKRLEILFKSKPSCNTEKYAMALMFMRMSDAQLEEMGRSMGQLEELKGQMPDTGMNENASGGNEASDPYEPFRLSVRLYVHDLYRFFFLFCHREEMLNPFTSSLILSESSCFSSLMRQPVALRVLGNFCFDEQQWGEATSFFEQLPEDEKDAEIFGKMGYCNMMLKDYAKAARFFDCSNMINPSSTWTLRQLARACMLVGRLDQAREALLDLERRMPEDQNTLLMLAECSLKLGENEQALSKLHKANYLQPDNRVQKALAWCLLQTGKYEEAENLFLKILENAPTAADFLNAGHAAWLSGKVEKALERYKKSVELSKNDLAPIDFFREDAKLLQEGGKTALDLLLMRDLINNR